MSAHSLCAAARVPVLSPHIRIPCLCSTHLPRSGMYCSEWHVCYSCQYCGCSKLSYQTRHSGSRRELERWYTWLHASHATCLPAWHQTLQLQASIMMFESDACQSRNCICMIWICCDRQMVHPATHATRNLFARLAPGTTAGECHGACNDTCNLQNLARLMWVYCQGRARHLATHVTHYLFVHLKPDTATAGKCHCYRQ